MPFQCGLTNGNAKDCSFQHFFWPAQIHLNAITSPNCWLHPFASLIEIHRLDRFDLKARVSLWQKEKGKSLHSGQQTLPRRNCQEDSETLTVRPLSARRRLVSGQYPKCKFPTRNAVVAKLNRVCSNYVQIMCRDKAEIFSRSFFRFFFLVSF